MKITPQNSLKLSVALGFALIVLLVLVLAVVGLLRLSESNRKVEQIVSDNNVKTSLIYQMKDALRGRMASTELVTHMQDPFRQNDEFLKFSELGANFTKARSKLESMTLSTEEKAILDRVRDQANQAQPVMADAMQQALQGNHGAAQRLMDTGVATAQTRIAADLDKLLDIQRREAEGVVSDTKKSFEFTRLHMLVLASFAIGLGLMVAPVVIRKAKSQADSLQHEAMFDSLTHLPNRMLLADRLEQAIRTARHEQRGFGLFVIDIDQFRKINSSFGHEVGDQVLQYLAACIQACTNEPDTLARLNGDEFAFLSMGVSDVDDAIALAINIRKSISEPIEIAGRSLKVTASVGIVLFPHHGEDFESLMHAADSALRAARQTKRGYRVYSADMAEGAEDRLALIHELRDAFTNNEFVLHYQPKVDFKGRQVSGVEALVRWAHPANGLMTPEQFVPLAEQIGLIQPLTDWVLDSAFRQYAQWYQDGIRLPMSVKITAASLQDPAFPDQMEQRLRDHQIPADKIEIEFKETAEVTDTGLALECLRRLRDMDFQIAIGDFGTGDSSMLYLTEMLISNIKIDKDLVKSMVANRGGSMMVRTAVNLGHTLGLKVIAKGVENQASWDTLQGFGCDAAQGYFMGRPLPPVELVDWVHASQRDMPAHRA